VEEDQLKTAKMVIAGWIKDWSCLTLYQSLSGKLRFSEEEMEKLCNKYKFLPAHYFWYVGKPKFVRTFIADFDKKLSDALWDTEDNMKKLKFAEYLAKLDSTGVKAQSKYSKADKAERDSIKRKYRATVMKAATVKEHAQKMNGTHWRTVK